MLHPFRLAEFSVNFSYSIGSSLSRVPACHVGGPGSIPGRCSSIFGIWRKVLRRNVYIMSQYWDVMYTLCPSIHYVPVLGCTVYITSQYFFPAIIYSEIISHITITYRYIMYFFRTFKKSTAPYKVHNMGLRYIKIKKVPCNAKNCKNLANSYIFQ